MGFDTCLTRKSFALKARGSRAFGFSGYTAQISQHSKPTSRRWCHFLINPNPSRQDVQALTETLTDDDDIIKGECSSQRHPTGYVWLGNTMLQSINDDFAVGLSNRRINIIAAQRRVRHALVSQ